MSVRFPRELEAEVNSKVRRQPKNFDRLVPYDHDNYLLIGMTK
jgi:hypothetical protein